MISNSTDARKLNVLIDQIARERVNRGKGRPPRRRRVALPATEDDLPQAGQRAELAAVTFFPAALTRIYLNDPTQEVDSIEYVSGPVIGSQEYSGGQLTENGRSIYRAVSER